MLIEICMTVILMCVVYYGLQLRNYQTQMGAISAKCSELGPRHPFWGHLYLFSSAEEFVLKIRKHVEETGTKLFSTWIMFFRVYFHVCHPDTVRDLLKSSEPKPKYTIGSVYRLFMPWLGDGLLVSGGKKWERNRRLLSPAFHFDILKPYIQVYNKTTDILLKNLEIKMEKDGHVEVYELLSMATLDTMLRCALSYEGEVQKLGINHSYVVAVKKLSTLLFERSLAPWYFTDFVYFKSPPGREFARLAKFVHDFADQIIESRKQTLMKQPDISGRRLDFLDILLTARDESGQGLSSRNIREEVDTFLFEGHDTTASSLSWAIYALGKYQNEQDKVYAEIKEILQGRIYVEWFKIQIVPNHKYEPLPEMVRRAKYGIKVVLEKRE